MNILLYVLWTFIALVAIGGLFVVTAKIRRWGRGRKLRKRAVTAVGVNRQ